MQDLGRTDIHRLGIPHEEKLGGIVWVHVLHYHVRPPSALINAVSTNLYKPELSQNSQRPVCSMRSYMAYVHQEFRMQLVLLVLQAGAGCLSLAGLHQCL